VSGRRKEAGRCSKMGSLDPPLTVFMIGNWLVTDKKFNKTSRMWFGLEKLLRIPNPIPWKVY
jgi:hypothetical protein